MEEQSVLWAGCLVSHALCTSCSRMALGLSCHVAVCEAIGHLHVNFTSSQHARLGRGGRELPLLRVGRRGVAARLAGAAHSEGQPRRAVLGAAVHLAALHVAALNLVVLQHLQSFVRRGRVAQQHIFG